MNPMQCLPLYSKEVMKLYKSKADKLPPHIFCVGNEALTALKQKKKPQCIIVTGESGSGKSKTTNYLTEFLYGEKRASHVEKVLEAFGNCTTTNNDNSSRFVKLLQVCDALFFNKMMI